MVETAGKSILVDPGNLSYDQSFMNDWAKADIILITHKHGDHCHAEVIKNINAPIYSTAEIAAGELLVHEAGGKINMADELTATNGKIEI
jgi:L-ascorbate metabolism protein UlaG (beta-lactamase superfamily)